jgi:type IV pilus assembly protein PilN
MLHSNLSTRPFYNDRAVRAVIAVIALVALGLTVFNVGRVWWLRSESGDLRQQSEQSESLARDLRQKAQAIRQSLNRQELAVVQSAAREANQLIDRRAFSWTDLFNRFETTLPPDVRLVAVQPQVDADGRMLVAMTVVSRRVEDLDEFIDALEKTGAFRDVLTRQEQAEDDGTRKSVLQGYYGAPATPQTAASTATVREVPTSEIVKVVPASPTASRGTP